MGRDLLHDHQFRQAVTALDHIVELEMGFSAIQALEDADFDGSDKVQALMYIMQIGLSAIFRSKGLSSCDWPLSRRTRGKRSHSRGGSFDRLQASKLVSPSRGSRVNDPCE